MNKFKWKSANIPTEPREFTKEEDAILDKLKFGKNDLGKARKEAKRNVKFTITLLENNGASDKGCYMAVHELGKLLGSVKTAQKVIACIASITTCNNHWDRTSKTPRRFKIDDLFKNCNVMAQLKAKIATPSQYPAIEPETPQEDLTQEIMNRDLFDPSTLLEELELTEYEPRQETREDYIKAGIDPDTHRYCPNCRNTYNIISFTLDRNRVCRNCWRKCPDDAKESSRIDFIETLPKDYVFTKKDELELFDYQDYMKSYQ